VNVNTNNLYYKEFVTANNRFLSVNATKPGSCHDSNVFKDSSIGRKCARGHFGNGQAQHSPATFTATEIAIG